MCSSDVYKRSTVAAINFGRRARPVNTSAAIPSRENLMRLGLLIGLRVKRKRNNDSSFLKIVPPGVTQDSDDHYLETRITIVAKSIGKGCFCLRAVFSW